MPIGQTQYSEYLVSREELVRIADAIRNKNRTNTSLHWPGEMVSAISNIGIGSEVVDWTGGGSVNVAPSKILENTWYYNNQGVLSSGTIPMQVNGSSYYDKILTPLDINSSGTQTSNFYNGGYYQPSHGYRLNTTSWTITPSSEDKTYQLFGEQFNIQSNKPSGFTSTAFPQTITIKSAFTGSSYSTTDITCNPQSFTIQGNLSIPFSNGFYINSHKINLISSNGASIITPSVNQVILFGPNATYNYFPYAINIPATDWTGGGSINIASSTVLQGTYFYNTSGNLSSGNISIRQSFSTKNAIIKNPTDFTSTGALIESQYFSKGYYAGIHGINLNYVASSSNINIIPTSSSQQIILFGNDATQDYFPRCINIEGYSINPTDWSAEGVINITSSKALANTWFYTASGSLSSGTIGTYTGNRYLSMYPSNYRYTNNQTITGSQTILSGFYSQSIYIKNNFSTSMWIITPSNEEKYYYLISTYEHSYGEQLNKPTGFNSNYFPYAIKVESMPIDMTKNKITIRSVSSTITSSTFSSFSAQISEMYIPECTYLSDYAFFTYLPYLKTANFPNCSSMGVGVFRHCYRLTDVSLPAIPYVPAQTFSYCSLLTNVNIPPNITIIGSGAFNSCLTLSRFSTNFLVCSRINASAFYNCYKLKSITADGSYIGSSAFFGCSELSYVSFSNCTTIKSYAFQQCINLTSVNISTVQDLSDTGIFSSCTALKEIFLPNVLSISDTFTGCTNLQTITLGPSCTSITGTSTFYSCHNLISLYLLSPTKVYISHSMCFSYTPFRGYSASTSSTPHIYVPSSLVPTYQSATIWSYFSSYIIAI